MTSNKYILSGDTPLSTGGNNSISIGKANLPNTKLKVDSFSVSTQPHRHEIRNTSGTGSVEDALYYGERGNSNFQTSAYTRQGGGENTGTASPYTEALGSGSPINIQPQYITLRFWKRLS